MSKVHWGIFYAITGLMFVANGCGKAGPAPAPPAGGAVAESDITHPPTETSPVQIPDAKPAPTSAPTTTPPTTTNPQPVVAASATTGATDTASAKVDPQIQQRLLAISVQRKAEIGEGGLSRNDMKLIGLALHNFSDVFNGLPAVTGRGNSPQDKDEVFPRGLSWRVMLLPFFDELALYQQFHLDEAWDSPHNLALVGRMPKVYGVSPEGKTRLHILTGNGAPFKQDKSLSFAEISDGMSNTMMAFVGGPDTAEIWTKPVAREFDAADPLKSFGNVGDKFLVLMMDGSANWLSKDTPPETLARLVKHQDGESVDFGEYISRSYSTPVATAQGRIKVNAPAAPPTAAAKRSLNYIPDDAFAAFSVYPRRIVNHPLIKSLSEQYIQQAGDDLPWKTQPGVAEITALREQFGIALENLDEVVVVVDKSITDGIQGGFMNLPAVGLIAKNSAPLDVDGLIAKLTTRADQIAIEAHEGVALIFGANLELETQATSHSGMSAPGPLPVEIGPGPIQPGDQPEAPTEAVPDEAPAEAAPKDSCQDDTETPPNASEALTTEAAANTEERMTVAIVSDSVILVGAESVVKKMISARNTAAANTGLTKQLEAVGAPLISLVIDTAPIDKPLKKILRDAPPPVSLFAPYILGVQSANLSWDLDASEMLNVSLKFKSPELAQGLYGVLDQQYQGAKGQYPGLRQAIEHSPTAEQLLPSLDHLVADSKLSNSENLISLTVPQIKNPSQLLEGLQPILKEAQRGAQRAVEETENRNKMKQIGLAFHNFHDTWSHFPANNGLGEMNKPNRGLSWRVYLLPYLDQAQLYSKFNLDEPWDSPTNIALVKSMPKIFGANAEGKTSIHVFVGEGSPFGKDEPTGIRDFTDGTSNTFLAVQAGDDVAEIWTKPGGLPFAPADPAKSLGTIKEFLALFGDGAVRNIKDISSETLGKLIQHADGQRIDEPF